MPLVKPVLRSAARPTSRVGELRFNLARASRKVSRRWLDDDLAVLRDLRRAYSGRRGPDVLFMGDSTTTFVPREDTDRRRTVDMLRDALPAGTTVQHVAGRGYNCLVHTAFLEVIETFTSRPKVVVATPHPVKEATGWLNHPIIGFARMAEIVRESARTGRDPGRVPTPSPEEWEAYDEQIVESFLSGTRPAGEIRLIVAARAETKAQRSYRLRHMYDSYFAETIQPDGRGAGYTMAMSEKLVAMGIPSIAHQHPINYQKGTELLGPEVPDRLQGSGDVIADAWARGGNPRDTVLVDLFGADTDEFCDPLHLSQVARERTAKKIAEAVVPLL